MTGIQSSVYIVWIYIWNRKSKKKEENYGKKESGNGEKCFVVMISLVTDKCK